MRKLLLGLATAVALLSAGLAGTYKGTWSGAGGGGDMNITLTQSDSDWKADASFTLGGETVKTKVTTIKVDGNKLTLVYTFDLQGNVLESSMKGELKDGVFSGDYQTKATADGSAVDAGTWTAKAQ
jgi:hypothetical protein